MTWRAAWAIATTLAGAGCGADDVVVRPTSVRTESPTCRTGYELVAVNRADGTPVGAAIPLSAAKAALPVEAGDLVTAVAGGVEPDLQTIVGVEPGDQLALGATCELLASGDRMRVRWAAAPGATHYRVCSSCTCTSVAATTIAISTCPLPDARHEDFLVVAMAADTPTAYAARAAVLFTPGGEVDLGTLHPAGNLDLAVDAVPGGLDTIDVIATIGDAVASPFTIAVPSRLPLLVPVEGPPVRVSTIVGGELIDLALPPRSTAATLSVPDPLPSIHSVRYDVASRTLDVAIDGATPYDLAVFTLAYWRTDASMRSWTLILPPGVSSVTLPLHPALAGAETDLGRPVRVVAELIAREDLAGYAAALAVPTWQHLDPLATYTAGFTGVMRRRAVEISLGSP